MKRVMWTVAMAMIGVATVTLPPRAVSALEGCGDHCVTSGFCPPNCWTCQGAPFEMTCS